MIEVTHVDSTKALTWLEYHVRPHLRPDVSNYAKGRLRVWLRYEPMLFAPFEIRPALAITDYDWDKLHELTGFDFDYCLCTYSGANAIGISPHRDAGYATYEAMAWNISGTCKFSYWNNRQSFGAFPNTNDFPATGEASHVLELAPGDLVRFNCKNLHQAVPSANRWNINFWKKK